jgi:hypothetical protein
MVAILHSLLSPDVKTVRVIAAFIWYAVLALFVGVAFQGACIGIGNGERTIDQLVTGQWQFKKVLSNASKNSKEPRFWIIPVLLAAGLGGFMAHMEFRDGTAFAPGERESDWDVDLDDD